MEYMSTLEAAKKWGISVRQVQRLLAKKRIPCAIKYGNSWMIPKDAEKPMDLRRERQLPNKLLSDELSRVMALTIVPMPITDPDSILDTTDDEKVRLQYESQIAYLRGDFKRAIKCFFEVGRNDAAKLLGAPVALAGAMSMGDYQCYIEIDNYLKDIMKSNKGTQISALAELSLATVSITIADWRMAPDWLKQGDFSSLPSQVKPHALYLRAKYFQHLGKYEAMLAVAQTALTFCSVEQEFIVHDIYLRLICAIGDYFLGRMEEAKGFLMDAMNIGLPHGFITPFVESIVVFGGLVELCLKESFLHHYGAVIKQWDHTWRNWIYFHNQLTKDNITLILSLREYHIAELVARHVPNKEIAKHHHISVGRLKNIISVIYDKLQVSNRDELAKHIIWAKNSDF